MIKSSSCCRYYVSYSLSAVRRAQVEQHVKKCSFCAEKLKAMHATRSVARSLVVVEESSRSSDSGRYARRPTDTPPIAIHRLGSQSVAGHLSSHPIFNLPIRIVTVFARCPNEVRNFLMRKFQTQPNSTFDCYAKLLCQVKEQMIQSMLIGCKQQVRQTPFRSAAALVPRASSLMPRQRPNHGSSTLVCAVWECE